MLRVPEGPTGLAKGPSKESSAFQEIREL